MDQGALDGGRVRHRASELLNITRMAAIPCEGRWVPVAVVVEKIERIDTLEPRLPHEQIDLGGLGLADKPFDLGVFAAAGI